MALSFVSFRFTLNAPKVGQCHAEFLHFYIFRYRYIRFIRPPEGRSYILLLCYLLLLRLPDDSRAPYILLFERRMPLYVLLQMPKNRFFGIFSAEPQAIPMKFCTRVVTKKRHSVEKFGGAGIGRGTVSFL